MSGSNTFGSLAPGMMPQNSMPQNLFGGGMPMGVPGSYIDPLSMALAGAAQAMGEASRPSRLPAGLGSVIGEGAGGFAKGALSAQQGIGQALNNQLFQGSMPARLAMFQQAQQAMQGIGPGGVGQGAGGTPDQQSEQYRRMLMGWINFYAGSGQDRASEGALGLLGQYAGGPGYFVSPGGRSQPTPGGSMDPSTIANRNYAAKRGEAPFEPPVEMDVPDPNNPGSFMKVRVPRLNLPGLAGGGAQTARQDGGFASLPTATGQGVNLRGLAQLASSAVQMTPPESNLWASTLHQESGAWWPNKSGVPDSSKGAIGLGQVMPDWAMKLGLPSADGLRDPVNNIMASARIFHQGWTDGGGDPRKALASYYGADDPTYYGPILQRVQQWGGGAAPQRPNVQVAGPSAATPAHRLQPGESIYGPIPGEEGTPATQPQQPQQPGIPGAIQGPPVSTPTQAADIEFRKSAMLHQFDTDQTTVNAEQQKVQARQFLLGTTQMIRDLAGGVRTGVGADELMMLSRGFTALGMDPNVVNKLTGMNPSDGEALNKMLVQLSTQAVREMGAREPGSVINLFLRNYPNIESRPETIDLLTRVIDADQTWHQERLSGMQQYLQQGQNSASISSGYRGMGGFDKQFAQQAAPRVYLAAALAGSGRPQAMWAKGLSQQQQQQVPELASGIWPSGTLQPPPAQQSPAQQPGQAAAASLPPAGTNRGADQGAMSVRPTTRAEVEALPKGTKFIWTDGRIHVRQ